MATKPGESRMSPYKNLIEVAHEQFRRSCESHVVFLLRLPMQLGQNSGWEPEPTPTRLKTPTAMMTYAKMMMSQDDMMSAPLIRLLLDYRRDRAERLNAQRLVTQVMKSKRVFGENTPDCYGGEDTGDEGISVVISAACRQFGAALDMRLGVSGIPGSQTSLEAT